MPNSNNTLVKLKTGTVSKIKETQNGNPVVPLNEGTVYFAVDIDNESGKILYDAPYEDSNSNKLVKRISMNAYNDIVHYGECEDMGSASVKNVACPDFKLRVGARVIVTFASTNTASNLKLNVGGSGARDIYYEGAPISPSTIVQHGTYEFVYGTDSRWIYVGTIAMNIAITIDESQETLFITSPITNGDGVSY